MSYDTQELPRNELNLCFKQNRPDRSYRDTLLSAHLSRFRFFLITKTLCLSLCEGFFFLYVVVFLSFPFNIILICNLITPLFIIFVPPRLAP